MMNDEQGLLSMVEAAAAGEADPSESRAARVKEILDKIISAKKFHSEAFKRMKENQRLAREGAKKGWGKEKYRVNIMQRHIKQKTAALYAKNPRAVAKINPRLYYQLWSGDIQDLQQAVVTMQQAQAAGIRPGMIGQLVAMATGQQALMAQFQQAQALMADVQQAEEKKKQLIKIGKTLEILFEYYMNDQMPGFKLQMKQLVRRAITCTVGYIKLGFQREMSKTPEVIQQINDATARLAHMQRIMDGIEAGDIEQTSAEAEELKGMLEVLQNQNELVLREGLTFNFPQSTSIIIDPSCTQLRGFMGANWVAEEFLLSADQITELFGTDVKKTDAKEYEPDGKQRKATDGSTENKGSCLYRVYEFYDKLAGMLNVVLEGHDDFLQEPAEPVVYTEQFFPYYALTFNDLEDDESLYSPADLELIEHIQYTVNGARQALAEHRNANRPKFALAKGMLEDDEKAKLQTNTTNAVIEINALAQGAKIDDILQAIKGAPIDNNLYDTNYLLNDLQIVLGAPESTFGATSGDTATEVADAAGARTASTASNVDDFDEFFTEVSRAAGQILLLEMAPESVTEIVGPGAMWPSLSRSDVAREITLTIEAGSSGKPNKGQDTANMERLIPLLIQVPGISPLWLAKQVVKRMDEHVDLDEALAQDMPSMIAINAATKQAPAGEGVAGEAQPGQTNDQGEGGANNQEKPVGSRGGAQPANGDNTGAVVTG